MVGERQMPNKLQSEDQREDMNWEPRSEVMVVGTPNLEIHPENKAWAQLAAEMAERGIASGQRVVRSITVRRYLKPPKEGKGPTMLMWM